MQLYNEHREHCEAEMGSYIAEWTKLPPQNSLECVNHFQCGAPRITGIGFTR